MYKKLLLCFIITVSFLSIQASPIDEVIAGKVAVNFMKIKSVQFAPQLSSTIDISEIIPLSQGETMAFAVNFSNDRGFVIIAADNASKPILGYSYEGSFSSSDIPPVVADWMQFYYSQIQDIRTNNLLATAEIEQEWENLLNGTDFTFSRDNREVTPLLTTTWDQGARYNELCPEAAGGPGGRVWAGCVATAMSQIINYWRYPLQGTGSHGYYSDYGYLFADFGASNYDFSQMNDNINGESNYEMAEIQYHCGIAVDMMYSPNGSGAYSDDAAAALRDYFGYAQELELEYKDDYSDIEWAALLMDNLDNGWPLYYHGFGSGGHAFNVDGYQGNDYFHFNWGWSGSYNGYFYLTNLNPGGNDFTWGQGAIVNFHPNTANYPYYCSGVSTLTRHNGTIEDGSGPVNNYINGLQCGWLIAPEDSVSGLTLYFDKFDLAAGDVINVFDGSNSSAPLVGSFTDTNVPSSIPSTSGNLYIEFLTSGDLGHGWRAHYSSYLVNYCPGISHHTEAAGSFSDGSGPRDYRNGSICKYIIEPENAAEITVSFDAFKTEADIDKVKVYDMISQTLMGEFSGNQLPDDVTIPSGKAYIIFVTNQSNSDEGWEVSYTSTVTDVKNIDVNNKNINLYCTPNPADNWLRMELRTKERQNINIALVSSEGRIVNHLYNGNSSNEPMIIMTDVSMLKPGIYVVKYWTDTESGYQKIIIK